MPNATTNPVIEEIYTPKEIIEIYRNYYERVRRNQIIWMRGIYNQRPNQNRNGTVCYDELRDADANYSITLKIENGQRQLLQSNSLIRVGGMMNLTTFTDGKIQIALSVSRFETIENQFVTEEDKRRSEIRIAKTQKGFQNIDLLLEEKLFRGERPRIALIFAQSSITMADFRAGVNAASANIDFTELRHSFGNGTALATFLQQQDNQRYDAIALIRGGGSGIEALDDINVLHVVSNMQTPVICAIGHVGEELFLKSIADKVAPTPNGLGQYFSEMVERVVSKRNNSRAALVQEVERQFKKQLEDSNKRNKELLMQIEKMTKQQNDQIKANKETIDKINDQNRKNLEILQKKNDETLAKFQEQSKQQMQQLQRQETLLERERQTTRDLERRLNMKPNHTLIYIVIAFISLVVGFVLKLLF